MPKDETPLPTPSTSPTSAPAPAPAPEPVDPPMGIERLEAWIAEPKNARLEALAVELLDRCGDLVVKGIQYRIERASGTFPDGKPWSTTKILSVPREFLGMDRAQLATGIDKLKIDSSASE